MGSVKIERRETVLVATLDNPPHALMDRGTVEGLDRLVAAADSDPAVRAVVLTGSHPDRFVAHYDVGEILAGIQTSPPVGRTVARGVFGFVKAIGRIRPVGDRLARTPLAGVWHMVRFHDILLRMNRSDVVYVAAINGSTMGGGCELSLACDHRIMAAGDYVIGQPEVLLGIPPGAGGTQRLVRLLGVAKALEVALDGMPLSAERALEIGLVDELVDRGEVVAHAIAWAERIATRPPEALGAVKRAVYEGGSMPFSAGLAREAAEFAAAAGTTRSKELMAAYVERLQHTGALPAYDRGALARFAQHGEFD